MTTHSYRPGYPRCETSGKICYPSQAKANKKARTIRDQKAAYSHKEAHGRRLRVYLCEHCGTYHLTSRTNVSE